MDLYFNPELIEPLALIIDDPIGGGGGTTPPPDDDPQPYMSWQEYLWGGIGVVCVIMQVTTMLIMDPVKISIALLRFVAVSGTLAIISVITSTRNYFKGLINLAEWCAILASFILKVISYVLAILTIAQYALAIAFFGVHIGTGGASLALQIITVILTITLTVMVINSIIIDWNDEDPDPHPGW